MRLYGYNLRILYLPMYLAIPIWAVLLVISVYLLWWLINGAWPAIIILMATVMMIVETWDRTRQEKGKIISLQKINPL